MIFTVILLLINTVNIHGNVYVIFAVRAKTVIIHGNTYDNRLRYGGKTVNTQDNLISAVRDEPINIHVNIYSSMLNLDYLR